MTKILIIEDNDDIRENIAEILTLANYQTFEANNGKTGVELAIQHLPDLILCDIMMGELDGYGVLHLLHKHPDVKATPFIFITAKAERPEIRKGMEMGADDYLTKPFDDLELLNAIEGRLKKKEEQRVFYSQSIDKLDHLLSGKDGLVELRNTIKERKVKTVKKNHTIYYEGDYASGIHLIISGKVKTVKMTEDGRELMTGIFETDDFVGLNALFSTENHGDTATTLEESELAFFPKDQFEKVISLYPDLAGKFIKILSNEIIQKEEQLLQLAYQSVRKRIADAILRVKKQGNTDEISITRNDLAALSGTAPETVSRTLKDFREEGLISKKGSAITIENAQKLEKLKN